MFGSDNDVIVKAKAYCESNDVCAEQEEACSKFNDDKRALTEKAEESLFNRFPEAQRRITR